MPQIAAVEERGRQLPGVRVESRPRRRYLYGELFAHVIGYVGEVGRRIWTPTGSDCGYRTGDMIGKQGVEAALEDVLRGQQRPQAGGGQRLGPDRGPTSRLAAGGRARART